MQVATPRAGKEKRLLITSLSAVRRAKGRYFSTAPVNGRRGRGMQCYRRRLGCRLREGEALKAGRKLKKTGGDTGAQEGVSVAFNAARWRQRKRPLMNRGWCDYLQTRQERQEKEGCLRAAPQGGGGLNRKKKTTEEREGKESQE